jgi:hypothetical protein
MAATLKVAGVSAATAMQLRQVALQQNRSVSEVARLLIERGLGREPPKMPDHWVAQAERGTGLATAVYLSAPIASAVRQLAISQDRSQSWIVRSILRDGLRSRGLLSSPQQPEAAAEQR